MSYFLLPGTDIDGYDPAFKKYYNRVFGADGNKILDYRPTNPLNDRTGTYAFWTQTSPEDGAFSFKLNASNFNTTPFLAPYMKNALTNDEIQQLQYNKDMAEAYAILAGEIATFDTAKSGTQADQLVFKPDTLAKFMKLAKAGLSAVVKLAALPVENLKWYQFEDKNPDAYKTQLATSAAMGTGASRTIYATDRMSNAEIEAAMNETYQTVRPLYYQFSNFMEFFVNKMTKKYHFRFVFDGSNYGFERQARFDRLTKLADKGLVLDSTAYASVMGIEPQLFEASLRESKYSGWITEFSQMLINANIGNSGESGRPKIEGSVNDSTEYSREEE